MREADTEPAIMNLAARQHGLATRRQLLALGLSPDVVDRRVKSGRYRTVQRGVYLVGPLRTKYAREMAAVLACGERGVVSHRSAAAMLEMLPCTDDRVHIIGLDGDHSARPGIVFHKVRALRRDEVVDVQGVPVTSAARTLFDLAGVLSHRELERVLARALSEGLVQHTALVAQLSRHAGRSGTTRLLALLNREKHLLMTRSEAEEHFLALVRAAQLPDPEANVKVHGHEVDFYWKRQRFIVEVDGYAFHSAPGSFESDRRRDAVLAAAGIHVMRVTWKQIVEEPHATIARVAQSLVHRTAG